jgi:probable F420-dependent oxidoreductase
VKIDAALGSLDQAKERSRAAEQAGYDGLWTGEVNADPFLSLAVAAGETRRVDLGTQIAVALARSPMTVAYTANDLQRQSKGRFFLGLGSQVKAHITRRFSMPWHSPAPQMREYVLALRAIWSSWQDGTPLQFEGEYYQHTLMTPNFVPPPHEYGLPRVVVAGVGESMTCVAGEVADGFVCHGFTTARWIRERSIPAIEEGLRRGGRTMDGFDVSCAVFLVTGTDQEIEARIPAIRAQIAFYASTQAYRGVLELDGWGALGQELTVLSKEGRWADMSTLIDDDILNAFAVVAPPDEVPGHIRDRYGGLLTRMWFTPPASMDVESVGRLIGKLHAI